MPCPFGLSPEEAKKCGEFFTGKSEPMPQEGFCDVTHNGPFCVDRATFEAQYLASSMSADYGGLLFGVSMIVLASIIGYKLYKANKRK